MLDLYAEEWRTLDGGYRQAFDASKLLRVLAGAAEPPQEVWESVWNNLYHQHDVGIASYAVMPWLLRIYREKHWLDFDLPSYAFAIEQARSMEGNPRVPDWLVREYDESVEGIFNYCFENRLECDDPNFKKALVLLAAVLVGAYEIADLVDFVALGDELQALELYANS
jgi:hypothetical protein